MVTQFSSLLIFHCLNLPRSSSHFTIIFANITFLSVENLGSISNNVELLSFCCKEGKTFVELVAMSVWKICLQCEDLCFDGLSMFSGSMSLQQKWEHVAKLAIEMVFSFSRVILSKLTLNISPIWKYMPFNLEIYRH